MKVFESPFFLSLSGKTQDSLFQEFKEGQGIVLAKLVKESLQEERWKRIEDKNIENILLY